MEQWIKMRHGLEKHPAVLNLAAMLKLPRLHVVGCLYALWSWADQYSLEGVDMPITDDMIDGEAERKGFASALRKVGWLEGDSGRLTFPRFGEHNGKTAKKRLLDCRRKERSRGGNVRLVSQ